MKELTNEIKERCNCANCEYKKDCPHCESFRRYPFEFGGVGACKKLYEKQYMVTTATPDERVKTRCVTNIYTEEVLRHSDYKDFIPKELHQTTIQVDKVLGINSTALADKDEYIEWVTTITRIA